MFGVKAGLGFNGVVIDLQQHFETYPNCQILPKFTNKIYDNVVDFRSEFIQTLDV